MNDSLAVIGSRGFSFQNGYIELLQAVYPAPVADDLIVGAAHQFLPVDVVVRCPFRARSVIRTKQPQILSISMKSLTGIIANHFQNQLDFRLAGYLDKGPGDRGQIVHKFFCDGGIFRDTA